MALDKKLNKDQLINYLLQIHEFEVGFDLIQNLSHKLGISPDYPIILVGGTNGKGSTCAYLTTILVLAGYKVGSFTSPHVLSYNERISINNKPISDIELEETLNIVVNQSDKNLGIFKSFALSAYLIFQQQKVDIAIIEVGVGGRSDITNMFEPTISAITCVDFDHCHILGYSLSKIGLEKAGIFRSGKSSFFGSMAIPESVIEYAKSINTSLEILGKDFGYTMHNDSFDVWCNEKTFYSLPFPALRGNEQLQNVALSLAILTKLRNKFPLSLSHIKTGLLQVNLLGRFQIIPGNPQIILDVAHNPQAVSKMLTNMVKLPYAKKNFAVFGVAKDKDVDTIIEICKDSFLKWFIAPIGSMRSMQMKQVINIMENHGIKGTQIHQYETIKSAYISAKSEAMLEDRIICFGSFLVVEECYNTIYSNNKR